MRINRSWPLPWEGTSYFRIPVLDLLRSKQQYWRYIWSSLDFQIFWLAGQIVEWQEGNLRIDKWWFQPVGRPCSRLAYCYISFKVRCICILAYCYISFKVCCIWILTYCYISFKVCCICILTYCYISFNVCCICIWLWWSLVLTYLEFHRFGREKGR